MCDRHAINPSERFPFNCCMQKRKDNPVSLLPISPNLESRGIALVDGVDVDAVDRVGRRVGVGRACVPPTTATAATAAAWVRRNGASVGVAVVGGTAGRASPPLPRASPSRGFRRPQTQTRSPPPATAATRGRMGRRYMSNREREVLDQRK